jgi:hypothetical protein
MGIIMTLTFDQPVIYKLNDKSNADKYLLVFESLVSDALTVHAICADTWRWQLIIVELVTRLCVANVAISINEGDQVLWFCRKAIESLLTTCFSSGWSDNRDSETGKDCTYVCREK